MDQSNEPIIEEIHEKIRTLTGSYGTEPYGLTIVPFSKEIRDRFKEIGVDISAVDPLIAIFLWADYSVEDMRDYLLFSFEYGELEEDQKDRYLKDQLGLFENPAGLKNWIEKRASVGIGITDAVIRKHQLNVHHVPDLLIDRFSSVVPAAENQKLFSLSCLIRHHEQSDELRKEMQH